HAPDVAAAERLTAAFNGDDALYEIRTDFGNEPAERTAGRMRHDDGRTDLVEQHRAALTPDHVLAIGPAGGHAPGAEDGRRRGDRGRAPARSALRTTGGRTRTASRATA